MEITGYDYILYSNIPFSELENDMVEAIKDIWENPIIDKTFEGKNGELIFYFVAKDKEMYEDDTRGYELNEEGEGVFSIIVSNKQFKDHVASTLDKNRKPYMDMRFLLVNIWSYTLVLPELIENSSFSMKIYKMIVDILSNNNTDEGYYGVPIQKPAQFF